MAQYDVHTHPGGPGLLLDCQANLLSHLSTRFVVPLLPEAQAPKPAGRLNPVFTLNGERYVMVTQFAAAIECRELGALVARLAGHDREIATAIDLLVTGV